MKKFFGIFFVMIMMSTVVCAADFIDTSRMNCEYLVDRIATLGIVNGTGGNKFEPEKVVTRAEFSKMVTLLLPGVPLAFYSLSVILSLFLA